MNIIAGIDPGQTGAIALLNVDHWELEVHDTPTFQVKKGKTNQTVIDTVQYGNLVVGRGITHCFLEQVGSMPKQGVSSTFKFGTAYGAAQMIPVVAQSAVTNVTPQKWKKGVGIASGAAKDESRRRATQLMPNCAELWKLVKHDGRADAALIAYYAATELGYKPDQTITPATLRLVAHAA